MWGEVVKCLGDFDGPCSVEKLRTEMSLACSKDPKYLALLVS